MRMVMLSHTVAPWTPHYARYFAARGDEVLVITMSPHVIEGVRTEFIGAEPFDKYKNKHLFLTRLPRIRRRLREFRPDLVYAAYLTSNGLTAVLSWSGPLVLSARGGDVLGSLRQSGPGGWMRRAMLRYVCRHGQMIHTVSRELDETLASLGVPADRLVRIPVGVDLDRFRPRSFSDDASPQRVVRMICTRRHEPVYDMPTIVRALRRLRDAGRAFEFSFVGGGYLIDEHRRLAESAGLAGRVRFLGHCDHVDLPRQLASHDVYVSASRSDGTSSSLLEAMAAGLYPVVTRIAANRAWLDEDRTARMFEPGDDGGLADALERAIDDRQHWCEAAAANRLRVEQDGDQSRNMQRLAELFERVAAVHRSSRRSAEAAHEDSRES